MTQAPGVQASRKVIAPPNVARSASPVSPAVQLGNLVFLSGQTAGDVSGVDAQTRAILEKIGAILRVAGSDYSGVLRCGVYLADIRTFEQMNAVYREFFPRDHPARTTVECKMASPSVLVEIDCIASVV